MDFNPGFKVEGSFESDMLIAGDHPTRTRGVTIVSGQNLTRGALLGRITASGKYTLSVAAAEDGSETPVAILGEDIDASDDDQVSFAYIAGDFNQRAMTFGTGHTAESVRDALNARSIYVVHTIAAGE